MSDTFLKATLRINPLLHLIKIFKKAQDSSRQTRIKRIKIRPWYDIYFQIGGTGS